MKMASLGVIMEMTKVLGEETETSTDGSGYKPEENPVNVSDLPMDNDGSAPAAFTALESNHESICRLDVNLMDKETGDGNAFYLSNGGNSSDGGGGQGRANGEKLENGGFRIGDFVWGKIKSHPWWPGQVYDPRDASEFAVKHSQEGRLLVAFFGDGSCSWCLPSQLVPFIDNFRQMSSDGSSKNFVNAIQRAVDEVGRLVETKMMCKCVPMQIRDRLARPAVANAGVREGVLVPEVDVNRLSIPEYEPVQILFNVKNYAKTVSVENMFELGILKSWLSAFYYAKYGSPLAVFKGPFHIEGMDEEGALITNDYNVPIEVPVQGPSEEDWTSSFTFDSAMSQGQVDDKIYYKRKQKSVAELMENDHKNKPNSQKRATLKEGKRDGKLMRKRRVDDFESGDITERKLEKIEVAVAQDSSYESKDEMEMISSPRERKKSKYLSPPYTNLSWKIVDSRTKLESDSHKKTAKASSPVSELDDETSDEQVLNSQSKMSFFVSDVDVTVNELLSEVAFAALDPFYLRKKGSLDMVWGFISAFRSSTYLHGSEDKVHHKSKRVGRKRKSLPSLMRKQEKEDQGKQSDPESGPAADDLVSDVGVIRQKLDVMTAVLENCSWKFSTEEASFLKDEMKSLINNVETVTEKVREMGENASS